MSSIFSIQSGLPFTVTLNTNRSLTGASGGGGGTDRPDVDPTRSRESIVSGVSSGCGAGNLRTDTPAGPRIAQGTPLGTPTLFYDPCAFSLAPTGFLGNEKRNILRGPGFEDIDFSVVKDTSVSALGENGKVQFRAEFFNLFNRPNFGQPGLTIFAGSEAAGVAGVPGNTAGIISRTSNTARQIQLALKIIF
jgi:hypothetical protein